MTRVKLARVLHDWVALPFAAQNFFCYCALHWAGCATPGLHVYARQLRWRHMTTPSAHVHAILLSAGVLLVPFTLMSHCDTCPPPADAGAAVCAVGAISSIIVGRRLAPDRHSILC